MKPSLSTLAKVGGAIFATILAPLLVAIATKYTDAIVPAPAASAEPAAASSDPTRKPDVTPSVLLAKFAREIPELPKDGAAPLIRLFNGQGLAGFYTFLGSTQEGKPPLGKNKDPDKVFSVTDGLLSISGQCPGTLVTEKEHANYRLRLEYKWGDKTWPPREKAARTAGVTLHAYGADGAVRGNWMQGIRCQIMEGGTGDLLAFGTDSTHRTQITFPGERGGPLGEGKGRRIPYYYRPGAPLTTLSNGMVRGLASDPDWKNVKGFHGANDLEKPGEWNTLECLCDHDRIVVAVNGKVVNAAIQVSPARGRIALVSMGAQIQFRTITLQPLE